MPKEIKCFECGKKMRSIHYHLAFESSRNNGRRGSKEGWEYKYVCKNDQCMNYQKEFDLNELEDQDF